MDQIVEKQGFVEGENTKGGSIYDASDSDNSPQKKKEEHYTKESIL